MKAAALFPSKLACCLGLAMGAFALAPQAWAQATVAPVPASSNLDGELRRRLAAAGYEVLLPRVDGERLEWVVDGPDTSVSSMGIAEPTGAPVDLLPLRAMLIPALAVTAEGDRLGKGGGYYDRVLADLRDVPVVALVDDPDVVDSIPAEAHDMRVHAIVTPTRTLPCTAP